jgi:hypothetical protein
MRYLLPLLYFLILAGVPGVARAQEPNYTLQMGGGNDLRLRIEATGKELRLYGEQKPGSKGKVAINASVTLDAEGKVVASRSKGVNFAATPVDLAATVEGGAMVVSAPALLGRSPVAAPVLTFVDLLAVLGRRYNWQKGGPQVFAYLDPALKRRFATLTIEAESGVTPIKLTPNSDEETLVRKLNLTLADAPEVPEARRKSELFVGPNGEVLQGRMPVTGYPVVVGAAGKFDEKEGFITRYPNGIEPQGNTRFTRVRRSEKGYKITYEGPANLIRGTVETDAQFRPVRVDHQETWRRFAATLTPTNVSWEIPERKVVTIVRGEGWFLPFYVLTGAWESRAPFAELTPGQLREVTYTTMEWGDMNGANYTVQRLPDTDLTDPDGKAVLLKHWQVVGAPYFAADLWTDGKRLVKLASSAGATITRDGWEKATEKLVAPPTPKK